MESHGIMLQNVWWLLPVAHFHINIINVMWINIITSKFIYVHECSALSTVHTHFGAHHIWIYLLTNIQAAFNWLTLQTRLKDKKKKKSLMIIFGHMLSFMWRRLLEREAPYHAYYDSCRFLAVKTFHGTSENQSWNSGSSDRHLQWPSSHVSRNQRSAKPFSCPQLASVIFPSHYTCSHGCPLLLEVQWEEILFKALHLRTCLI